MLPWTDRAGRVSPLKIAALVGALLPLAYLLWRAYAGELGPRPLMEAIHRTGDWAIRFLWFSLLVSPLRRAFDWPGLIVIRRHLGLAALGYAALHLTLYVADLNGDLVKAAAEVALRFYLTIGFVALLILLALGATSFDAAIKRLGAERWNRLHRLAYLAAVIAVVHFALQSKRDVSEPVLMAGLLVGLFALRLAPRLGFAVGPAAIAAASTLGAALAAVAEAGWYAVANRVPLDMILLSNLDPDLAPRPAHLVLAIGLGLAAATALARLRPGRRAARPRRAAVSAR
jgi:sulfoxide reductase heme-binding subunit YedZ